MSLTRTVQLSKAVGVCGDTSSSDPSNISLLDSNGDSEIDLSDLVYFYGFLFLGSSPPVLGTECVPILGCEGPSAG